MGQKNHRISVCTSCRHTNENCLPGINLVQRLSTALAATSRLVGDDFEMSGYVLMTECKRACTLGYQCSENEILIFGDIHPQSDINDLIGYAKHYSQTTDTASGPTTLPGNFDLNALSQRPAAMIMSERCEMLNS